MKRDELEELFYGKRDQERRFTQDFPILPDVWFAYAQDKNKEEDKDARLPLLLTPCNTSDAPTLALALRQRLEHENIAIPRPRIVYNESVVMATLSFRELLRLALPLSDWWRRVVAPAQHEWTYTGNLQFALHVDQHKPGKRFPGGDPKLLKKLIVIVGAIECDRNRIPRKRNGEETSPTQAEIEAFARLFEGLVVPEGSPGLLWSVSRNRPALTSVWRSRQAVKADAVAKLFDVEATDICWAVLDTGIDARHPAFAVRKKSKVGDKPVRNGGRTEFSSRVVKTYDFLRIQELLDPEVQIAKKGEDVGLPPEELKVLLDDLEHNLQRGRAIDWDLLEPFLRVPHGTGEGPQKYIPPKDSHGTHVAGILAADWPEAPDQTSLEEPLRGICPGIELYDMRVLGEGADEFTIIAALQFVRHLNAHKDLMVINGVNLSIAVQHDVANFACGRTPVCEECERVVSSGVVVVTAAGNRGFNKLQTAEADATGDYRYISITDPGNAESVITVGATHRFMPHTYGVSYFSSRGPTGDGRTKPDLVAPGERIDSCSIGGDYETMDGTSMAAPHVSGAAALLMARNRELIGQPRRVKEILCKSATDLGREPRFQGAGMLDILRALQSV
ncbi:MAG TPA: S8 family peptidase [Bryobacteraceae bacterium]|nr:S8 family peptidase [Bryobacteraceae bacterium]